MGNNTITEVARKTLTNTYLTNTYESLEIHDAEMILGRWIRTEVYVYCGTRVAQSTRCLGPDDVSSLLASWRDEAKEGDNVFQGTRDVYRCRACRNKVPHTVDLHNEYVRCTREGDVAPLL